MIRPAREAAAGSIFFTAPHEELEMLHGTLDA
jgi:hypothetical protein